jgi:hypothetical protein
MTEAVQVLQVFWLGMIGGSSTAVKNRLVNRRVSKTVHDPGVG